MPAAHRQTWKSSILIAVMAVSLNASLQADDVLSPVVDEVAASFWDHPTHSSSDWKSLPRVGQVAAAQGDVNDTNIGSEITSAATFETPERSASVDAGTDLESESVELKSVLQRVAVTTGALGLTAVLGLWLFRAWLTQRRTTLNPSQSLEVLETLRIGPRCGLYLVQADRHRVLVGIDQGRTMHMLTLPSSFADSLQEATASETTESEGEAAGQKPIEPQSTPFRQMRRFWQSGVA